MDFALDPRLSAASGFLAELPLCMARLQDDARFPWIVLIPRRPGARDLDDLSLSDLCALNAEIRAASAAVRALAAALGRPAEKLNIASIGNIVPQLHIHIVARRADDPIWPAPVWGAGSPAPYEPQGFLTAIERLRAVLSSEMKPS